ncbi:MAG: hypothetical protein A3F17_02640 [Gammaproteobacteria bacterium RIFCSPHIGHO2_12_FULL_41_15]|nr:MAG: hypothetical protein A3F17_02640 [Gammaproteobacteria bacterium RIFCSPHIGHO2_12_FULL_41_15]
MLKITSKFTLLITAFFLTYLYAPQSSANYAHTIALKIKSEPLRATEICSDQNDLLCEISSDFQPLYTGNHIADYQKEIRSYGSNPAEMEFILINSKPYLYYVFQKVKEYHLPAQLVFVPAAETNYQAHSISSAGAAGLWQFMPATAHEFNIHMRPGYDGRSDILQSTDAGLHHLMASYKRFGNWLLAMAAYNCGDGRVDEAIRYNLARHRPTDFWSLPLPHQTKVYVRNILAISAIMTRPSKFGIKLPDIPNRPYFSKIQIKQNITPSNAGFIAGINFNDMKKLNPAITDWQNTLNTDYTLLVPQSKKEEVLDRLSSIDAVAA